MKSPPPPPTCTGLTKEDKASSESLRLILVVFLGGCTFSEISALRFLGREKGKREQRGDGRPPWDRGRRAVLSKASLLASGDHLLWADERGAPFRPARHAMP